MQHPPVEEDQVIMEDNEPQPAFILKMPPEIQAQICSHVVSSSGKPSIQALLRTCKQLYEVALPFSVSVFRNTPPYGKGEGPCSRVRNVQFLRYILITKPELRMCVKSVVVGSFSSIDLLVSHEKDIAQPESTNSTAEEIQVYQKTIKNALEPLNVKGKRSWRAGWVQDLWNGHSDAQIALILLACPNIQSLLFEQCTEPRQFIRLLRTVGSLWNPNPSSGDVQIDKSIIPLSKLQDVFHESSNRMAGYDMLEEQAPVLFHLPNLRYYECNLAFGNETAARQFEALPERSSPVEDIAIRCSVITGPILFNMLKVCKAVKKLEYTRFTFYASDDKIMPREILDAALLHADTLEELYMNMEEHWDNGWEWEGQPEKLYMGVDLCRLQSLKKLTISMQCLIGKLAGPPDNSPIHDAAIPAEIEGAPSLIQCLPESLEELNITSCGELIREPLTELLGTIAEGQRFTRLTRISLLLSEFLPRSVVDDCLDVPHVEIKVDDDRRKWDTYDFENPNPGTKDGRFRNKTSRIYAPDVRQIYLKTRPGFRNPSS